MPISLYICGHSGRLYRKVTFEDSSQKAEKKKKGCKVFTGFSVRPRPRPSIVYALLQDFAFHYTEARITA